MSYVQPGVLLAIVLIGLGFKRKRFGVAGLVLLVLWASPPVAMFHSWLFEVRYPARDLPSEDAEVIVVLAGGLREVYPTRPQPLANESTYERSMFAAWLYKNWKPLPVVVAGGPIGRSPARVVVGDVMAGILVSEGIPETMVWREGQSLNTYENAVRTVAMLRAKGVRRAMLVTDGRQMPRAEASFRKQGFEVVPAPCCFSSVGRLDRLSDYFPSSNAIKENEACLHEWLGLIWYWLRGRI
ncbi:MAG: YdcF family protein [bacterium]|nr:YdcF family protein [bacterium]